MHSAADRRHGHTQFPSDLALRLADDVHRLHAHRQIVASINSPLERRTQLRAIGCVDPLRPAAETHERAALDVVDAVASHTEDCGGLAFGGAVEDAPDHGFLRRRECLELQTIPRQVVGHPLIAAIGTPQLPHRSISPVTAALFA